MSRTEAPLRSCLYECTVAHERLEPVAHRFVYRVFYILVDLDERALLDRRLSLFSVNRGNVMSLREADFLPIGGLPHNGADPRTPVPGGDAPTLKGRALALWKAHGIDPGPDPRVLLLTLPRVLGYQFNPVSFYFCVDASGAPRGAIAEVTNTFREVKPYVVPLSGGTDGGLFHLRVPKDFYVSPFSGLGLEFDFNLRLPGRNLGITIDDYQAGHRVLHSALAGAQAPLTDRRLAAFLLKYPLITLKVIALIHWQALLLRMKRAPFIRKAADPGLQRDVYRPHRSIAGRSRP